MKSALALGNDKPLRLIRAASKDRKLLEEIGLLHNIGHDDYRSRAELADILRRPLNNPPWPRPKRNREQPIYILQSSQIDDLHRRTISGIKKIFPSGAPACGSICTGTRPSIPHSPWVPTAPSAAGPSRPTDRRHFRSLQNHRAQDRAWVNVNDVGAASAGQSLAAIHSRASRRWHSRQVT